MVRVSVPLPQVTEQDDQEETAQTFWQEVDGANPTRVLGWSKIVTNWFMNVHPRIV
jgi:hypothetical protein